MEEKGSEIRDCNFERDTGFDDFTKRDSGNVILKSRDPGSPLTKMYEINLRGGGLPLGKGRGCSSSRLGV